MYNHTGLQGRLTADPELRHTPSGVAITSKKDGAGASHQDTGGDFADYPDSSGDFTEVDDNGDLPF